MDKHNRESRRDYRRSTYIGDSILRTQCPGCEEWFEKIPNLKQWIERPNGVKENVYDCPHCKRRIMKRVIDTSNWHK
jgi:hypothetical protein